MAQVIDRYRAEAGGSSAMYYYQYADNTSAATRLYSGTVIYLHKDYADRITAGMYLMVDPSGWIPWYYVQNVKPVYKTVTDACTPPDKLTIDRTAQTLTITGGAGGDLNALTGFGVSFRERAISSSAWGEWSEDTVTAGRILSVSAGSGMVRQYRARTLGEAGSGYYSSYVICETLLNGNTAAGTPAVILPVSGMETIGASPTVRIDCPAEPVGDGMTLQRSLDGGGWTDAAALTGEGGTVYDTLSVEEGGHTVRYRLVDANGEAGGEDAISFVRSPANWSRAISPGDVIANREISFASDVRELMEKVNGMRAFYGMPAAALPGTPGRAGDWACQLQAMQTAAAECRAALQLADAAFEQPASWPRASQINQLRSAIENT